MPKAAKPKKPRRLSPGSACVKCRTLRIKCVRRDEGETCAKCDEVGIRCVLLGPVEELEPPRPYVPSYIKYSAEERDGLKRLMKMNEKLEQLMGLLKASGFPVVDVPRHPGPLAPPDIWDDGPAEQPDAVQQEPVEQAPLEQPDPVQQLPELTAETDLPDLPVIEQVPHMEQPVTVQLQNIEQLPIIGQLPDIEQHPAMEQLQYFDQLPEIAPLDDTELFSEDQLDLQQFSYIEQIPDMQPLPVVGLLPDEYWIEIGQVPDIPEVPRTSQEPQPPQTPQAHQAPHAPEVPPVPPVPRSPQTPQTPQAPQAPQVPHEPHVPHVTHVPHVPHVHRARQIPQVPHIHQAHQIPQPPQGHQAPQAFQAPHAPQAPEASQASPAPAAPQVHQPQETQASQAHQSPQPLQAHQNPQAPPSPAAPRVHQLQAHEAPRGHQVHQAPPAPAAPRVHQLQAHEAPRGHQVHQAPPAPAAPQVHQPQAPQALQPPQAPQAPQASQIPQPPQPLQAPQAHQSPQSLQAHLASAGPQVHQHHGHQVHDLHQPQAPQGHQSPQPILPHQAHQGQQAPQASQAPPSPAAPHIHQVYQHLVRKVHQPQGPQAPLPPQSLQGPQARQSPQPLQTNPAPPGPQVHQYQVHEVHQPQGLQAPQGHQSPQPSHPLQAHQAHQIQRAPPAPAAPRVHQHQGHQVSYMNQLLPGLDLDFTAVDVLASIDVSPQPKLAEFTNVNSKWVARLGLSLTVLEHLLDCFRALDSYFPFVIIPAGWTIASMAEKRPFLLLTAVANACPVYSNLQQALHEEIKRTINHRVKKKGEKDLDLLQGLLLYLAWFHYYSDPRSQQAYEYLQIAISMASELGLDETLLDPHSNFYKREGDRASIGCSYLSQLITASVGKPNLLDATDAHVAAADRLSREQEYPTDKLLYPLMRLQSFAEVISGTYALGNSQICGLPGFFHAEHLSKAVEEWWAHMEMDIHSAVLPATSYRGFLIRIHQMGLSYRHGQQQPPRRNQAPAIRAPPKISINLTKSVSFSKQYLDWVMAIPLYEYIKLPVSIWYQLILATTVLYKLSLGLSNIPGRDSKIAKQTSELESYLGILGDRLRSTLPAHSPEAWSPTQCLFAMLSEKMDNTKQSYQAARSHSATARGEYRAHPYLPATSKHRRSTSGGGTYRYPERHAAPSFEEDSLFRKLVGADIQQIESDKLWNDVLATDSFLSGSSTAITPT